LPRHPQPILKPGFTHPLTNPAVQKPRSAVTSVHRALVVDDERTIRSSVARYLRKRGWQADEAEDGHAAVLKLEHASPDAYQLVISDLRMPHYSGDQLHDWMQLNRPDLFVRLILTTGDLTSPLLKEFIARTPRPLIEKPFELAALGQLVDAVVHGR